MDRRDMSSQVRLDDTNGSRYDELIGILSSDDDGEMYFQEIIKATGWKENEVIKRLKRLIQIRTLMGKIDSEKRKIVFNSIDTSPYTLQSDRAYLGFDDSRPTALDLILGETNPNRNKKVTRVVKCPNCGATRQVLGNNIAKCDYCDSLMENKEI